LPSFGPLGGSVLLPGVAPIPPCGLLMLGGGLHRGLLPRLALSLSSLFSSPSSSPGRDMKGSKGCEPMTVGIC